MTSCSTLSLHRRFLPSLMQRRGWLLTATASRGLFKAGEMYDVKTAQTLIQQAFPVNSNRNAKYAVWEAFRKLKLKSQPLKLPFAFKTRTFMALKLNGYANSLAKVIAPWAVPEEDFPNDTA